jgi:hypothetical protein
MAGKTSNGGIPTDAFGAPAEILDDRGDVLPPRLRIAPAQHIVDTGQKHRHVEILAELGEEFVADPSRGRGVLAHHGPVDTAAGPLRDLAGQSPGQAVIVRRGAAAGGQHGRARGARTVTITLDVLQQALSDAAQQGLIVRNVAGLVQRPRQAHLE